MGLYGNNHSLRKLRYRNHLKEDIMRKKVQFKKVTAVLAAAALSVGLVACGGSNSGSADSAANDAQEVASEETTETAEAADEATEAESTEADEAAEAESTEAESSDEAAEEPEAKAIDKDAFDELVSSGVVADDADIEASEWAKKVKEAGVLRVGGVRTSFLFSQLDETDNSLRGFDAGLFQLLANYILGDSSAYEITQVDSSTRESVLQSDQVDAVFATYSITDQRKEVISFAGPYYTSQQGILVNADNTEITGVDALAGKTVATQAGSTGPDILAEFAPEAIVQEFETDQEAVTALSQGRVDAYVTDYTLLLSTMVKNPGTYNMAGDAFGPEDPYGIGLPLDSDGVEFVNGFLKKIEEDGTWEKLWKITLGDRTGISAAPTAPTVGE